jgi:ABC-type transporter Mla maintaining outer membrane lipid asymmetry ATPase subunit MlaF
MEPIVVVEGLKKSFGDNAVLDGVSMALPEVDFSSIIGTWGTG